MTSEPRSAIANNAFASVPEHVAPAELPGGETALLDLESGYYFHLNEVGTTIFRLIQERADLEEVVDGLMKEYEEVDRGRLRSDLNKVVDDLFSAGLLIAN